MDADDLLAQDRVAKQWIEEIDSFKTPPPPRRLADLNGPAPENGDRGRGDGGDLSAPFSSARDADYSGGCYGNNGASGRVTNAENEEMPQENFIVEKVRQFEDNDAHPYASHRRVETSKKIAAQGGSLAAFLVGEKGKQRISKEEASKLRATVLQENRVYNPYPNPYSIPLPANKGSFRRTDPSNGSGGSGSGSSSLISQTRDSSSSSTAGAGATPGTNSDGIAATDPTSRRQQQQRPQQLALQRRSQAQRSFSNPSSAAITTAVTGTNSALSSRGPTPLSSPSTTISSSALMSPRDDRSTVSSLANAEERRVGRQQDRKIYELPSNRTTAGGTKIFGDGRTAPLSVLNGSAGEGICRSDGDKRSSAGALAVIAAGAPRLSAPPAETPNSVEDEEMASIYRTFDAEVKTFGARQQQQEPAISRWAPAASAETQQLPSSGPYKKHHPLPPYTGIRQQRMRAAYSESPVPTAALPPPLLRSVFSPPVTAQQQYRWGEGRSIPGGSSRVPIPPPPPPIPPPLPARQPQRQRQQQQHYDIPVALRRPPSGANYFPNEYGGSSARPFAAAISFQNGYQRENGSATDRNSVVAPPPPPPPPPPPLPSQYSARRHHGATPIVDRIPAHEAAVTTATTPVIMRRSASHTTGTTWGEARLEGGGGRGSVAVERPSHYAGFSGAQNRYGSYEWHTSSVRPPPPLRHQPQQQQRASSFSGVLDRAALNGVGDNPAVERQQRMWNDLERQVVDDLEKKAVPIGLCHQCGVKVTNPLDATQALGHLYHAQCFTCCYCGRPLKGKKFYEARGKVYCEEDYLYSGFQHSAERCAVCGHLIMDMILQAVGKSFHPGCFKCHECRRGLENVPFTVDDQGLVYCIDDYHRLFAPRCAKCRQPITPTQGREETVRVVAIGRDYHIDCYACEGCGLRLTDENDKRCYPLGEHLLCQRCHVHWSRTGGASHPITDL